MNRALFLDRDGIINIDHGYVYKKENFDFVEGIFDLCRYATSKGFDIYVITNQSGIARGLYSIEDFEKLTKWMKAEFNKEGVHIADVMCCPHHPTKGDNEYHKECSCRKPHPGMILAVQDKYNVDLKQSIFIGDKISDMQAAESAGIHNRILVNSKYGDDGSIYAHRVPDLMSALVFIE